MGAPYIQDKELKKALKEMMKVPKGMNGAMARALNDGLTVCAKVTAQQVSKEYVVSQKNVRATFKKFKANSGNLHAYLESRGRGLKLADFPYSPKQTTNKRSKSGKPLSKSLVKVRVKRSEGRKILRTTPPAFTNNNGIKQRLGDKRFPIQNIYTISIPGMILNEKVNTMAIQKARERTEERLQNHIMMVLTNGKSGAKKK